MNTQQNSFIGTTAQLGGDLNLDGAVSCDAVPVDFLKAKSEHSIAKSKEQYRQKWGQYIQKREQYHLLGEPS